MDLIVVVPTYNEAANLSRLVESLFALPLGGVRLRLMVVDDASPDGTGKLADGFAERHPGKLEVVHRQEKTGLGPAYLEGLSRAVESGAELIGQMDADLSHDPGVLPAMIEAIGDADLVIGSRYVRGGSVDALWSWYRKMLSWSANRIVVPSILRIPVRDATSGYRLWRREALMRMDPASRVKSRGYGFLAEMAYLAAGLGCRIEEVPIAFRERSQGRSKMTLPVQLAAVRDILAIRLRHRNLT